MDSDFRPFARGKFLALPLDYIPSMQTLVDLCDSCIRERRFCRIMGISGPVVSQAREMPALIPLLERFTVIVPDGKGIELFASSVGSRCGPTLPLPDVCIELEKLAHRRGLKLYILGATKEVNELARKKLSIKYPGIRVAGRDGYYHKTSDKDIADEIKDAKPDILFAAMPTPKKEEFMNEWQEYIGVPVAVGCGGYIDTVAGITKLATGLVSRMGLSWLVRVVQEPKRLGRRILVGEIKFVILVARGCIQRVFSNS